jgi:two-component system sensor histidine kinase KdpD
LSDAQGPLYFDQDQIEQVMVNLLDNACRFTQKGGTIEVRGYPIPYDEVVNNHGREAQGLSSASPKAYRVDVSNTGPGILTEHLESVFEEYTSYSGSEDRSGGGLGLAICKMILTAHRGRIWAANYPGGVKFCFLLPTDNCTPRSGLQRNELTVVAQRAAS